MNKKMEQTEKHDRIQSLKLELLILTAKRSLRPSLEDNKRMWLIFEELHQLTNNPIYKL